MKNRKAKKKKCKFFLLILCSIIYHQGFSKADSLSKQKIRLPAAITFSNNLSASYTNYRNWKYSGYNNYSFLFRTNFNYDSISTKWETHLRFNGELGYMKFIDSIWNKNSDFIGLTVDIIKNTNKNLEQVFAFSFDSQILSTYEMYPDETGYYRTRWTSGFGNPMHIDLGYGTSIHFWKTCRVSLTFVTLRTTTFPLVDKKPDNENEIIYRNAVINSEYGLSIQTYIRKNIGKRLRWENYSKVFANAINRGKVDLDFRNRTIIKVFRSTLR